MKALLRKAAAVAFAFALGVSSLGAASVQAAEQTAQETTTLGKDFLKNVIGEYQPLFEGATFDAKYDHYWHDYSAAVAGESAADMCVSMMKKAIGATTYGPEAGEDFFCGFACDVVKITFAGNEGNEITFTKKDGSTVKHTYEYVKDVPAKGIVQGQDWSVDGYLYKSKDDNKDDFTYVYMCPDTPATTYHLEFRYGDTEENVLSMTEGKYKNWLAAGVSTAALKDPKETELQKVIALFVLENVGMMSGPEAAAQRAGISGVCDMDVTPMRGIQGYEKANVYITLSKSGTGESFLDIAGTGDFSKVSDFPFYVYDTDKNDGKEAGIYIVNSEDEGIKISDYEISEKDGKRALIFNHVEGELTYFYRDAITPAKPDISSVKGAKKKLTVSWKEVAGADGYKVLVSEKKNFKNAKSVIVKAKTSATVKSLKKNKTYFVKVCAYTEDYAGKKEFGKYSAVKKGKVK